MRWSGVAGAAILAGLAHATAPAAQPPQPPPPQPPTFRTEANLVRVDVTVVDRHGEPVTTLSADDFAVEEDGAPQTVQSFKFVSADGQPPPGDDTSLAIRSPEHAAAEASRDEVRVFVIFWDEYHIGRFADAIRGRKALSDFVASGFGPTDLVALMDPLLPVDALRFTRDRTELANRIRKLEGRLGVYLPTRSAAEDEQQAHRDTARVRSEVTLPHRRNRCPSRHANSCAPIVCSSGSRSTGGARRRPSSRRSSRAAPGRRCGRCRSQRWKAWKRRIRSICRWRRSRAATFLSPLPRHAETNRRERWYLCESCRSLHRLRT
jgi:hypothetical protein